MPKTTKKSSPPVKVSTKDKVMIAEDYLKKHYHFRYNPISDRTEFKTIKAKEYMPLTERDINSLFRELNHKSVSIQMSILKSILHSDFIPTSDPFFEYFESLPPYKDGDPDYIAELMKTVDVENKEFFKIAFPKWLVNTVACSINPNVVNQNVLVFVGKQGIGKSTWLNKLVPSSLEGYLYSGIVNPNNKDTLVNLAENFIINLDELENLNKTELGSLKALITQSAIKLRKAYGIFNENFTRRASFVGSVNEVEFLTDPTGNRRYLVISCNDIDYTHKVDIDKVYSQAYFLYKKHQNNPESFQYFFDKEDVKVIEENNQMFNRISIEEELVLKHFRIPKADDLQTAIVELKPTDMMKYLSEVEQLRADSSVLRRLGLAFQKHNFQKVSRGGSKLYKVVLIDNSKDLPPSNDEELEPSFKDISEIFSRKELLRKGKKGK